MNKCILKKAVENFLERNVTCMVKNESISLFPNFLIVFLQDLMYTVGFRPGAIIQVAGKKSVVGLEAAWSL